MAWSRLTLAQLAFLMVLLSSCKAGSAAASEQRFPDEVDLTQSATCDLGFTGGVSDPQKSYTAGSASGFGAFVQVGTHKSKLLDNSSAISVLHPNESRESHSQGPPEVRPAGLRNQSEPSLSLVEMGVVEHAEPQKTPDMVDLQETMAAMTQQGSLKEQLMDDPGEAVGIVFTVMFVLFLVTMVMFAFFSGAQDPKPVRYQQVPRSQMLLQPQAGVQAAATSTFGQWPPGTSGASPPSVRSFDAQRGQYYPAPSSVQGSTRALYTTQPARPSLAPLSSLSPSSRSYPAAHTERQVEQPVAASQPSSVTNLLNALPPTASPAASRSRRPRNLCPGLVVPQGSECVLAVRVAARVLAASDVSVDILDTSGKQVLRAQVCWPSPSAFMHAAGPVRPSTWSAGLVNAAKQQQPVVILKALHPVADRMDMADSSTLALCYLNTAKAGQVAMDICRASGELYGRLERDPARSRYLLRHGDSAAINMFFDGIFEDHAVLITDEMQEPLADAEPTTMEFDPHSSFFRLRVSSTVDVGLVVCCLLAIDEMRA